MNILIFGFVGPILLVALFGAIVLNYESSSVRYKKMKNKDSDLEMCVVCGEIVNIKKTTPIDQRFYYVEGAGQLCHDCYDYTYRVK